MFKALYQRNYEDFAKENHFLMNNYFSKNTAPLFTTSLLWKCKWVCQIILILKSKAQIFEKIISLVIEPLEFQKYLCIFSSVCSQKTLKIHPPLLTIPQLRRLIIIPPIIYLKLNSHIACLINLVNKYCKSDIVKILSTKRAISSQVVKWILNQSECEAVVIPRWRIRGITNGIYWEIIAPCIR